MPPIALFRTQIVPALLWANLVAGIASLLMMAVDHFVVDFVPSFTLSYIALGSALIILLFGTGHERTYQDDPPIGAAEIAEHPSFGAGLLLTVVVVGSSLRWALHEMFGVSPTLTMFAVVVAVAAGWKVQRAILVEDIRQARKKAQGNEGAVP